jgi:hypothetical protein
MPKTYNQILEEIFRDSLKERLGKNLAADDKVKDLIRGVLLKTGKISVPYVMRRFQCTAEESHMKIAESTKHQCREWDGLEIDYFSPEFEFCKCFHSIET